VVEALKKEVLELRKKKKKSRKLLTEKAGGTRGTPV